VIGKKIEDPLISFYREGKKNERKGKKKRGPSASTPSSIIGLLCRVAHRGRPGKKEEKKGKGNMCKKGVKRGGLRVFLARPVFRSNTYWRTRKERKRMRKCIRYGIVSTASVTPIRHREG